MATEMWLSWGNPSFKYMKVELTIEYYLFPLGYFCYQQPSNMSFSGYTVNCTFPENLCFKYGHKAEQVTVQGCISAEHCKRNEMKHLECCKGDMCNKGELHCIIIQVG